MKNKEYQIMCVNFICLLEFIEAAHNVTGQLLDVECPVCHARRICKIVDKLNERRKVIHNARQKANHAKKINARISTNKC